VAVVQVAAVVLLAAHHLQDNLEVVVLAAHMAVALPEVTALMAGVMVEAVQLELYGRVMLEHFLLLEQQTNNWR
jgi:hypothetical protein